MSPSFSSVLIRVHPWEYGELSNWSRPANENAENQSLHG